MKTTHTQGEWIVEDGNVVKCNGATICTARRINVSDEEAEANARLIASSPILLDVLIVIKEELDRSGSITITGNNLMGISIKNLLGKI